MEKKEQTRRAQQGRSESSGSGEQSEDASHKVLVEARRAAWGGALAAVVTLLGAWLVGWSSGAEARVLMDTSLPSTRSFCGTVTIALGNILALMLTLLSLSASTDVDLKWAHYQRVKQVALIVTFSLIGAVLVYLLLNVPLAESESGDVSGAGTWFTVLYYATLGLSSLLGGALITVALMLYNTVRDVIRVVGMEKESTLARENSPE